MGENSQSRYGIMDELNSRKIKVREELNNLEKQKDEKNYADENKIGSIEQEISVDEQNYKFVHRDHTKQKELGLRILEKDYTRQKESIIKEIEEANANFESDFQERKTKKLTEKQDIESKLKRYNKEIDAEIATKKEIIDEVEKGIDDLKEMSKETSGKEK